jgi:hypothetical protein
MKLSNMKLHEDETISLYFDFFPRSSSNAPLVRAIGRMMREDSRVAQYVLDVVTRRNRLIVRAVCSPEAFAGFAAIGSGPDPELSQLRFQFDGVAPA